ncbi:MAG: hypothetical protein B0D96_00640 [Candidatus Sedimenticola endophacoides]|uniref:Yip1 domain-containing protein n=1 Tax=Candidatus Sedimenticola endophacoides TaxID=2548426 RepID=A0A657Q8A0_9GAMM|nr:MAG: hypothetical protein B0D94_07515 [Candidatus Sedimenticola endophacoides]OQX38212.1 MAG: hypothetical protein B0D96_00640 [Candidatus Sedimenticola endophacoides]OQX38754.1 MAG: hypothetical protein B0D89_12175 [Candidatus Sedimenticola endophacoides]OQX41020.1 MAG: hypothetical protein B0D88_08125 [Candidatus Sedimenticola endophacoides]OQX49460.1 MAG: hypothetical protein B0D87_00220 [Candidatus Sedimenticola endophacoides]
MKRLIYRFVEICLLRAPPQALPASGFLLWLTALLALLSGTLAGGFRVGGMDTALVAQALELLALALLLRAGLAVRGHRGRFTQAASALFGSVVVINLALLPVQLMMGADPAASFIGQLGVLLFLLLLVWSLVVLAHILRHALDTDFVVGSLFSIGYFLFMNWLVQLLFTVP